MSLSCGCSGFRRCFVVAVCPEGWGHRRGPDGAPTGPEGWEHRRVWRAEPRKSGGPKSWGAPKGGGAEGWGHRRLDGPNPEKVGAKGWGPGRWGLKGEAQRRRGSNGGEGQNFALFFPSPATIFALFVWTLECARVEFSGWRVKTRRPQSPAGPKIVTGEGKQKSDILDCPAEEGPAEEISAEGSRGFDRERSGRGGSSRGVPAEGVSRRMVWEYGGLGHQ